MYGPENSMGWVCQSTSRGSKAGSRLHRVSPSPLCLNASAEESQADQIGKRGLYRDLAQPRRSKRQWSVGAEYTLKGCNFLPIPSTICRYAADRISLRDPFLQEYFKFQPANFFPIVGVFCSVTPFEVSFGYVARLVMMWVYSCIHFIPSMVFEGSFSFF
jgi:hypothetical protein